MGKLLNKLPFTSAEMKGLLFAGVIFLVGLIFRAAAPDGSVVQIAGSKEEMKEFSRIQEKNSRKETEKFDHSSIDNHQDFFDFTDSNSERKQDLDLKAETVFPLDLNRASKEELMLVPGIGEKKADAILALKEQIGRFSSVDQLDQVKGIGSKTLEKIRKYFLIQ